ncbi:MAG TPA: aldehyde ferredoxin oxidoreductase C-terminal domain-containing protein [Candidatus Krumholzibacteria bacterium]|nr:aldehyde ferredoxin oxidoreductase C-terminal domain-containing protein [Candidatus Krumholzibacteria bacterium]HPD70264.1 aldehyde ferredoxin oxidoreductase C-terminal domain-containing protein [Candidatus Krumholzibacteria bacterium]HRY40036.1 aldehyde ferredoxin oxidoreductase C-terminal domain-containing protein [Candidatus Krumholzibacteria bacterium]
MSAQPATVARLEITVDGRSVHAVPGTYLLKVLQEAGITIPTLCHHKDLTPTGNCRLCTCEIEVRGKKRLVTSCNYPVREPIAVATQSPRVQQHRKLLAEMYLGRWPRVPVIQEVARACGATDAERFRSELTDESPTACILCGHCVKACEEFIQERILDFAGRGIKRHLTMPYGEVDPHCIGCTSCAYVCPTGAIKIVDDLNGPVDPVLIRDHGMKINAEMATLDRSQCCMREVGTANIVDVMDAYDLLPVHNYRFGKHVDTPNIDSKRLRREFFTQKMPDGCWNGCSMACAKTIDGFELRTGPYRGQKVTVDGPEYETAAGAANMGCFDAEFLAEYNFYCDTYGIDTISFATTMAFVMEAYEAGVITKKHTGGKELRFGATSETLAVLHEMAAGSGFGVDVGKGVRWLKEKWVREYGADRAFLQDIGMEVKGLEYSEYVSKESLAQQAGYAMSNKGPQHDEAWLIFMDMVNNQIPSFEDKAEALYYFPLFRTWFGLMGLCKLIWNDVVPADNKKYRPQEAAKVPGHVLNFQKFFEGMTGIPLDEKTMIDQSARVHNLQRIMSYMLGRGTREHDMPPYRAVGPVTREEYESRQDRYDKQLVETVGVDIAGKSTEQKMALLREYREAQYNKVVDAAYERRGWTRNGVPTRERLRELGIDLPEIVAVVKDAW